MQFIPNHNALKKRIYFVFQWLTTLGSFYWISTRLSIDTFVAFNDLNYDNIFIFCFMLFLMPFNWFLEAKKWQVLINATSSLRIKSAVYQVLNGLLLSWVIPFTLGDIIGRIEAHQKKKYAALAVLWNRFSSLSVSIWFGSLGVCSFFTDLNIRWIFMGFIIMSALLIFPIMKWLSKTSQKVFAVTVIRYVIMLAQLMLAFYWLLPVEDILLLISGVTWIFLFRSILPSLWGAIGVRELSALLFFECCYPSESIVAVTLLIWIINLVLPSLLFGLYKFYFLISKSDLAP